ncbi:MAG: hypothetical protein QMD14_00705 [Candidatus Aenigmarchaeota archaeon]|nr:hypothetical protein [Candidatus Aenigmarchaeota archaeon]
MAILFEAIIFLISMAVLTKSSHFVVNSSVELSKITRLGEIAIGFLVLSVATNIPEIGVAFAALVSGEVGITVGNVIGGNVTDIALVVGVVCILTSIKITRGVSTKLSTMLFLSSLIPLLLLHVMMNKVVGLILLLTFIGFCHYTLKKRITLVKISEEQKPDFFRAMVAKLKLTIKYYTLILTLILGLAGVLISSWFVVSSASKIAVELGIATTVIGATIISLGGALPELTVGISSVKQGYLKLALGDIIGSCLTKLTLVLGLVLFLSPVTITLTELSPMISFVLIANVCLWFFLGTGELKRYHGILLSVIYFAFIATTYGVEIII